MTASAASRQTAESAGLTELGRSFERFERTSSRAPVKAPTATIQARGVIALTRAAWSLIDDSPHVVLMFDRHAQVLALKPTGPEDPDGWPVRPTSLNPERGPVHVAAKTALAHFGVDLTRTRRWPVRVHDAALEIPVGQTGTPVGKSAA